MDGQEEMTKDPLFLAVTRPALWAGVPIEAGALIIMAGAITLVGSGNPLYGGAAAVAAYAVGHALEAFQHATSMEGFDAADAPAPLQLPVCFAASCFSPRE